MTRQFGRVLAMLALLAGGFFGQAEAEDAPEIIRIAADDGSGRQLPVRVVRPEGKGPFPLAIVNHGSPASGADRLTMQVPTYRRLTNWLVARGYVVALPLRRGYGPDGGRWDESYGRCSNPDFAKAGLETARDIAAVLKTMTRENYVRKDGAVVFGQSAGGWGTLAFASTNPSGVSAFVNLSGGRGGHRGGEANANCGPERLVDAAGQYGRAARGRTLWLYTGNDSYFDSELASAMYRAYVEAGGKATFKMLPAIGEDGHAFISNGESAKYWQPLIGKFLDETR